MASNAENELIKAAWTLSKSNVEQWNRFLNALDTYTRLWMEKAVSAPMETLPVAVGMARQAVEFNENMRLLDELKQKITISEERRK